MGWRTSTPRVSASRTQDERCIPVAPTTEPGGRPARVRSSTPRTDSARAPGAAESCHCGSRRVTHRVSATVEISASSCVAETPMPTITTRCPANSSLDT
ncbi:Uncharacterised protein [Streptococcus pneumoniae]|nr:Uncharacterised protein [Streptococcus pneumoniae]